MNTIDRLGDYETFAKIIDGSITEFVDDSISEVGDYAFFLCEQLTNVDLPAVTQIGKSAFGSSGNMTINMPALVTIGSYAFNNSQITSVNFTLVSSVGDHAFYQTKLTTAIFPNLTLIDSMAFNRCLELQNVQLPELVYCDGSSVFSDCAKLTEVSLQSLKRTGTYMFSGCKSLTVVYVPKLEEVSSYSFSYCTSLSKIDLPSAKVISANAFAYDTNLATIIIRNSDEVASLLNINAFGSTNNTFIIYVPDSLVEDYKAASNWSTYADRIKPLSELPQEEGA